MNNISEILKEFDEKFILDAPGDYPVQALVSEFIREKLEALLGEITKEIEDDPAIRVDDREYAVAIIESKKV